MSRFETLLKERVLLLDGAMGTMIQALDLDSDAYRWKEYHAQGSSEILNLTKADAIAQIHRLYVEAGADIIETNTFCANRINLAEYHLEEHVGLINERACAIARSVAGADTLIAGVMGPTNHALSLASKLEDPAWRAYDFDDFYSAYREQAKALINGGVDLFLVETVFDTLVAKSAIIACLDEMESQGITLPIMLSVTFSDSSGRTLSGQSLAAFVATLAPYPLASVGINCSTGVEEMVPLLRELSAISPFYTSAHPNAGFPDKEGNYTQSAEEMAALLTPLLAEGVLNIVGGCCGSTDAHIVSLRAAVDQHAQVRNLSSNLVIPPFAGLDPVSISSTEPLIVGERTNVAGSRKFARLIREGQWDAALDIAREQVEAGAAMLDICMDASLLDAEASMRAFLRYLSSEPAISTAAQMIDSSEWAVIEAGMREVQGRAVINSISLKEGQQQFIEQAKRITRFGHAMVVMLFDERGQAETYERKMEIARRSYHLLKEAEIRDEDIIFDANVLAIATGIAEHDSYAQAFIDATHSIKQEFTGTYTSGGISNLSFSFRGNNVLREAMHSRFVTHAKLDMIIANPATFLVEQTLDVTTEAIIDRALVEPSEAATEALIALAIDLQDQRRPASVKQVKKKAADPKQRLVEAVVRGESTTLEADLAALQGENPIALVEGPLMDGMRTVGDLFSKGALFLPQVVRSARVMKLAVDALEPAIASYLAENQEGEGGRKRPVAVMATVKGDVHDIGKNIVSLILECNDFHVIDLGVMVEAEDILRAAVEHKANLVGLSGLITPSLKQMEVVIEAFEQAGLKIPIFVGGATTSELHTAVKLAPLASFPIIQTDDASAMALAANQILGSSQEAFIDETQRRYEELRASSEQEKRVPSAYREALGKTAQKSSGTKAAEYGVWKEEEFSFSSLVAEINWRQYCSAWKVPSKGKEAEELIASTLALLEQPAVQAAFKASCKVVYGLFAAKSDRLAVDLGSHSFYFLRDESSGKSLADTIAGRDTVGLFVSTAGLGLDPLISELEGQHQVLEAMQVRLVADRIADVLAQRAEVLLLDRWKVEHSSTLRPAPGYPIWSDHSEKETLFSLLEAEEAIGVALTESWAMDPPATVCGMLIGGEELSYFTVGAVSDEQLSLYAHRKGIDVAHLGERLAGVR